MTNLRAGVLVLSIATVAVYLAFGGPLPFSHQYTVDGPGGSTLTVYAQNLGGDDVPSAGEAVRLVWRPDHTFAVKPSEPLADWEEEQ